MAPCPRCGLENPLTAGACARCRTPLGFGDDPSPGRLDVDLDLDRRRPDRGPDGPPPPAPPPAGLREGADPGPLRPAASLRRAAAWAVDGGLLLAASLGLPAALLASTGAIGRAGSLEGAFADNPSVVAPCVAFVAVAGFVYTTVAHTLAGATLGKRLAGIRVVASDGRSPGPARSAIRSGWIVLSVALLGGGFLLALVTPSRRALHDLLAGTRVVGPP